MKEESKKYLEDIRYAIQSIETFMGGITDFSKYQKDLKTKSAVERQLGIIGEAAKKLSDSDTGIHLNHVQQIISLRNRIIHAYDNIDDTIIWAIWQNHLEDLKLEIIEILGLT
jgi:uncharacterized protein with HEPN domain